MALNRLTGLLLVFILLQVNYCGARNYQGMKARDVILGGRKMLHRSVLKEEQLVIREEGLVKGKISGASSSSSSHPPNANTMPGFVSINADYHDPDSHPPSHN
ncbi:hypothetical protein Ancab_036090 [Ancistrocladus abbreviatus]